jgi:hypothetical protein
VGWFVGCNPPLGLVIFCGWLCLFIVNLVQCAILFLFNMDSQPQEAELNMYPCTACGKNRLSHMQTAIEKLPEPRKQRSLQAVLWFS